MPCFPVFEDNQGAVQLSQNPVSNSNSKHFDVRHNFSRELVHQGDIRVVNVPFEYQHADILTKALAFDLFVIHRYFLNGWLMYSRLGGSRSHTEYMFVCMCFKVLTQLGGRTNLRQVKVRIRGASRRKYPIYSSGGVKEILLLESCIG